MADDSPLRIGPKTSGTAYRLIEGEWVLSDERIAYPEGWYVVPARFVHPEDFENEKGDDAWQR